MTNDLSNLYRLKKHDIPAAIELLVRAFDEDLLCQYFYPTKEEREIYLPAYFKFRLKYGLLFGEVYAPSKNIEGLAVWIHSKNVEMTNWKMFRAGGMGLYKTVGRELMGKMITFGNFVSEIHKKQANFPHWYLSPIAVDPKYQGQGFASLLMRAMLNRLDRENLPCFLETQSKTNVEIYKRYDFNIVEEINVEGTALTHWAMLRKPKAVNDH